MGKQVRIFDLLSKKQSLTVFKSQKKKNQLTEELTASNSYKKQLLEILESMSENSGDKTVSEIKSHTWYNVKLQDELIAVNNKIEFLSIEVKNQKIQVALAAEKQKKYIEKKDHFYKLERLEIENKRESLAQSASFNRSKI